MSEKINQVMEMFVPASHIQCSLLNFDWTKKATLKTMVDDLINGKREKGIVLIGDPGVGKSHLMVGMFKKMLEMNKNIGNDVMYIEWMKFVQETLDCMKFGVIPERVIDRLVVNLFLVDDIRPCWSGRIWTDMLKKLIEKIYEEKKVGVLSTNATSIDNLVKVWQIEDYWLSRLVSSFDVVEMRGEDRRLG